MKYFLAKTDPETYSIDDLEKDRKTVWDGVRNPQALRAISVLPDAKRLAESVRNGTPVSFNFKTIRSSRLPSFPALEEPDEILI